MAAERTAVGMPEPQGRGEDPLYHFTRVYLLFLQGLFKQFEDGSYHWSEDRKLSQIVITDQVPLPTDQLEQRPAIVTMRGPANFANLSHDQMRTVDTATGMKERTDLVGCTMSINCISKLGTEAQRIAWIVMSNLRNFKTLIQRAGFHKVGDELSIGPESAPGSMVLPEADHEMTMVTVQSPFFFQWTVKMTPLDAPQVREIEAHMNLCLVPVPDKVQPPILRPPRVRGVPIIEGFQTLKT